MLSTRLMTSTAFCFLDNDDDNSRTDVYYDIETYKYKRPALRNLKPTRSPYLTRNCVGSSFHVRDSSRIAAASSLDVQRFYFAPPPHGCTCQYKLYIIYGTSILYVLHSVDSILYCECHWESLLLAGC